MDETEEEIKPIKRRRSKFSPAGKVSFIRAGKHDLSKLLKSLNSVSSEAIEVLTEGLRNEDKKLAIDCAKTLVRFQVEVSKDINTDTMQRTIAEIRFNQDQQKAIKDLEDSEDLPVQRTFVDFGTIQES